MDQVPAPPSASVPSVSSKSEYSALSMIIALLFLKIAVKILIYILIIICLLAGIRWLLKSRKDNPAKQIANSCRTRFTDEEDIKKCERGEEL